MINNRIAEAARKLQKCSTILIGAGAGIGRDSGLPDFRGNEGFWNNYPPYRNKFDFYSCANPSFLATNPNLFWGFYGSRLVMYREKKPHKGFNILHKWAQKKKNSFVVTSNVDGHFQHVFPSDEIYQVHGSIHHLQCSRCGVLSENNFQPEIDYTEMSCKNVPQCQKCGDFLRPNILMFGDWDWMGDRSQEQQQRYRKFLKHTEEDAQNGGQLGIIEIGCGTAVPTIRNMCENRYFNNKKSILIRINPDEEGQQFKLMDKERYYHIQLGALEALSALEGAMGGRQMGAHS